MTADEYHLTPDQVAGYVAQSLAPAERAGVARHLDTCPECRAELLEVGGMVADYQTAKQRPSSMARFRRRVLPVAAALAAGLAIVSLYQGRTRVDEPIVRAADSPRAGDAAPVIEVVGPADGAMVADSVTLRWRSAGPRSYDVFLLSEDGRPLWTTQTADTAVRLPSTIVLQRGVTYFWRVDAIGNGVVASTGIRRLTFPR